MFLLLLMVIILQWNAQSLIAHGNEFKHALSKWDTKPDIICIQETWLKEDKTFKLYGYDLFRCDRNETSKSSGGGVAFFVKKGVAINYIKDKGSLVEFQVIEVFCKDFKKLNIINVYNPCLVMVESHLVDLEPHINNNTLICGDFNSHNSLWGSNLTDKNGQFTEDFMSKFDLICLNSGEGTRINVAQGSTSCIDISLTSHSLGAKHNWTVLQDTWGSDHHPILIELNEKCFYSPYKSSVRWSLKKGSWDKFKVACDEFILEPDNDNCEDTYNTFIDQLVTAIDSSFPKITGQVNNVKKVPTSWWNDKCEQAIKDRKAALKILKKSCHPDDLIAYKRACAIARKTIKQAKREDWRQFCSSINSQSSSKQIWSKIKRINKVQKKISIPVLKQGNVDFITDLDKANHMVNHFANVSSDENCNEDFRKRKKEIEENLIICDNDSIESILNDDFSMSELNHAIASSKCTTPGKDGISNTFIKQLPSKARSYLLIIFNMIWHFSVCPTSWKEAVLIPVLKPGKDPSDPKSYRPIALTSTMCKLMERMVNSRLVWYLENHNLFSNQQCGFRKGRSTKDHIIQLESSIDKAFANKESTLAVFLDLEKAYDMLWPSGVIIKLEQLGIHGRIVKWIQNFLLNRKIQVRLNGTFSTLKEIDNGTPQGSVISPTLFNIAVNDLSKIVSGVSFSQYADDIAIWKSNRNLKFVTNKIQENLELIDDWCVKWGFKLSSSKTIAVLFSNKRNKDVQLKLHDKLIDIHSSAKFLGVIFDSRLNWHEHINYITTRCKKKLNLLKCICGLSWGTDCTTLLRIYKALIKPVLEFGCEAFNSASNSCKHKLDSIQYQALRICTGALYGTALNALQVECGEPPLQLRRNFLCQLYVNKLNIHSSHPNKHLLQDCWQKYYFAGKWEKSFQHAPFEVIWNQNITSIFPLHNPFPYWFYVEPNISTEVLNSIKMITDTNEKSLIIKDIIYTKWCQSLHIYTDGSLNPNTNKVGCGIYIPYFKYSKSVRLNNSTSIYSAELFAILLALEWIEEFQPLLACIFSDCLSALQTISKYNPSNKLVCDIRHSLLSIQNLGCSVSFEWIPGHCGIHGNEIADLSAKYATSKEKIDVTLPLTITEIKHILCKELVQKWQAQWCDTKISSFKVIKPFVSLYDDFCNMPRWQEIIINRLRLGVFSKLKSYQFKIGKVPDGLCDKCKVYDDVSHFLLDCDKYKEFRNNFRDRLQYTTNQMTLKNIFKDKSNLIHVISFIQDCGSNQ